MLLLASNTKFLYTVYPVRELWGPGAYPRDSEREAVYTLDSVPAHRRTQAHTLTYIMANLEMPIRQVCMPVDCRRKESHQA